MEKKESPKKESIPQPRIAGFSSKSFGVVKFILGLCLLTLVYASSVSFLNEFNLIEKTLQNYFWWGLVSLIIIYLFIWEPAVIYTRGQRLLEVIFSFFKPLVRIAPYLLPIYTIILFVIYSVLFFITKSQGTIKYFVFLSGFSLGLHLIFSAKSLRSKQGDFLKANYIFGFSLIYIINLILLAFCLNIFFPTFSFVRFFNNSFQIASDAFYTVFKQVFL